MNCRLVLISFLLFSALGLPPVLAAPARPKKTAPPVVPVQVQVHDVGEQIKLVLDWKGQVKTHVRSALDGQKRMVIHLTPARLEGGNIKLPVRRGLIGVIDATQVDPITVRVTIPVMAPPVYSSSTRGPTGGLNLFISTMEVDRGTSAPPPKTASPTPASKPAAAASPAPASKPAAAASPAPASKPAAAASPAPVSKPEPAVSPPTALKPASSSRSQGLPERNYSMVFTGQDLAEVLTGLAEDLGLRAVLDPAVKGPVTTSIADLDAASALEAILRTQSTPFAFEVRDGQLRVFPSRSRSAVPQQGLSPTPAPKPEPIVTTPTSSLAGNTQAREVFPIHGRQAGAVAEGLKALYPQVVFQVDERLNVILVEGEANQVEQIRKVLSVFAQP
ncbi:MAG: hypothetical protein GX934_03560 [Burkholderiales bacterium]|nr:hypothetical protein [Burkholderiales bacterium]